MTACSTRISRDFLLLDEAQNHHGIHAVYHYATRRRRTQRTLKPDITVYNMHGAQSVQVVPKSLDNLTSSLQRPLLRAHDILTQTENPISIIVTMRATQALLTLVLLASSTSFSPENAHRASSP